MFRLKTDSISDFFRGSTNRHLGKPCQSEKEPPHRPGGRLRPRRKVPSEHIFSSTLKRRKKTTQKSKTQCKFKIRNKPILKQRTLITDEKLKDDRSSSGKVWNNDKRVRDTEQRKESFSLFETHPIKVIVFFIILQCWCYLPLLLKKKFTFLSWNVFPQQKPRKNLWVEKLYWKKRINLLNTQL